MTKQNIVWVGVLVVVVTVSVTLYVYSAPDTFAIATAQPTIHQILIDRGNLCADQARVKFLSQADKLDRQFQDAFALAIVTSRGQLSPVVASMQDAARQFADIPADACGEMVRAEVGNAYQSVIQGMLDYMGSDSDFFADSDAIDTVNRQMLYLDVYRVDFIAPVILRDVAAVSAIAAPTTVPYLHEATYRSLPCVDQALIERVYHDANWSENRYFLIDKLARQQPTSAPTPTTDPCRPKSPTPTLTPTPTPTVVAQTELTVQHPVTVTMEVVGTGHYDVRYGWDNDVRSEENVSGGWQFSYVVPDGTVVIFVKLVSGDSPVCRVFVDGKLTAHGQYVDGSMAFCRVKVVGN